MSQIAWLLDDVSGSLAADERLIERTWWAGSIDTLALLMAERPEGLVAPEAWESWLDRARAAVPRPWEWSERPPERWPQTARTLAHIGALTCIIRELAVCRDRPPPWASLPGWGDLDELPARVTLIYPEARCHPSAWRDLYEAIHTLGAASPVGVEVVVMFRDFLDVVGQ